MADDSLYINLTSITQSILEKKSLNSVFDAITETACTFFKASASSIMLFDREREYLTIARSYNLSEQYLKVVKVGKDQEVAGKVCQEKQPRFIGDVIGLFEKIGDKFTIEWAQKEGLVSLVCAPLLLKEEPIGCLNIYYRSPQQSFLNQSGLNFFTRLAALAIDYSQLIDQIEDKTRVLTVLEEVGLLLTSSFDFNKIIAVFLPTAVLISKTHSGGLILIDPVSGSVIDAYEYRKGDDFPKHINQSKRWNISVTQKVIKTKKPAFTVTEPDEKENHRSTAAIPLIAREEMIGILYIDSLEKRRFDKTEMDFLLILCSQAAIALNNTRLYRRLAREAKEMALLYEVSRSFVSTLDFDHLLQNILGRLRDTCGYLNLAIMLVDEEKNELYPRSYINYPDTIKSLRMKIGVDGICGHVAQTKKMYYAPDLGRDPYYYMGVEEARSEICYPLMIGDRLIGVLDIESPNIDGFDKEDINLLSGLSAQIALALYNAQLYEDARTLSMTDPLTGLPNRRNFDMFLESELRRSVRYRRIFSIMMIDFDDFKKYNDTFGHPAGDKILQDFSRIMKEAIRDVDFLGRYGGDEFIAVLPETDRTFALEVAERMRTRIDQQPTQPKITLSIGIASFPDDGNNKITLVELADRACYEAKQLGGNCINFAS